nr:hypothetical protein [Clostridium sp. Marseille-P7770]
MLLEKSKSLCEERAKKIISRDKKSRCVHRAINTAQNLVRQYQIDEGVITDKTIQKCDFLVLNDEKMDAYLIELKGTDLRHALEQLEQTERHLSAELRSYTLYYRIVYKANTHAIRSSEYVKFCKLKKNRVKASTDIIEEKI